MTQDNEAGMSLLVGTILGQLSQLTGISYPIKILAARPLLDDNGDYRKTIEVDMASGTYYVTIGDIDPRLTEHTIPEEP